MDTDHWRTLPNVDNPTHKPIHRSFCTLWTVVTRLLVLFPGPWRLWMYKTLISVSKRHGYHHTTQTSHLSGGLVSKICYDAVERDTLDFVWKYTTIPVPRVIDFVRDTSSPHAKYVLIMTRVEGVQLGEWLTNTSGDPDITLVAEGLKDTTQQLRSILPTSSMISSLYGRPLLCPRLSLDDKLPIGPFADLQSFHKFLLTVVHAHAELDHIRALARKSHSKPHSLCFTHGDLNHTNIFVKDGRISGIIDWESAGWLPEYWEYTSALWHGRRFYRVAQLIGAALPAYEDELEVEEALWRETDRYC